MNDTYSTYLQSEAWENKRQQRLVLSGRHCEACGSVNTLQIHHLTYERIFQEDMDDLMTLCKVHHEAVEEFCRKGVIGKTGDPCKLRADTLKFVRPVKRKKEPKPGSLKTPKTVKRQLRAAIEIEDNAQFHRRLSEILNLLPHERWPSFGRKAQIMWLQRHDKSVAIPIIEGGPNSVRLTSDNLNQGRSSRGGWNAEQLRCLGERYPLKKGWARRLRGSWISKETFDRFIALRSE